MRICQPLQAFIDFCRGHHCRLAHAALPLPRGWRGSRWLRGKLVRAYGRPTGRLPRALPTVETKMVGIASGASLQENSARSLQEKLSCLIRKSARLGSFLHSPSRATHMLCAAGDPRHVKAPTPATEDAPSSTCESASPCRLLWTSAGATTVDLRALHCRSLGVAWLTLLKG